MADLATVSDPTDWKSTKLPFISPLDAGLRCEVCKDFYTAPVITNCCHTFCSLCIRRALHADGICPICRTVEQEYRLRKNTTVQDLLDAFVGCRPQLYEFATKEPEGLVLEGSIPDGDISTAPSSSRRSRRSQRRTVASGTPADLSDDECTPNVPSPPPQGLVDCPICGRRMKEATINSHVDKCLVSQDRPQALSPPPQPAASAPPATRRLRSNPIQASAPPESSIERLAKLNYYMLNEKQLRQKVRQLGIPDNGDKRLLQERHTEWLNLWNAAGDSPPPRPSKIELLKALDTWERAHVRPANNKTRTAEWSDAAWAAGHQGTFSSLIEQAKRSVKRPKLDKREGIAKDIGPVREDGDANGAHKPSPEAGRTDVVACAETSGVFSVGLGLPSSQPPPAGSHVASSDGVVRLASSQLTPSERRDTTAKECQATSGTDWFRSSNPTPVVVGGAENALQPLQFTVPQQPSSLPRFSTLFSEFKPDQNDTSPATASSITLASPTHPPPLSDGVPVRTNEKRKYSSIEELPLTGPIP